MKKPRQVLLSMSLGDSKVGTERMARWRKAALRAMQDPKLFHAWIRRTVDQAVEEAIGRWK